MSAASVPTTATTTVQISSAMRQFFIGAAALVSVAAFPLFFLSEQTNLYFAWTIQPPLTAAFLGAGYWAVTLAVVLALREREWTRIRIVLPVLATGVVLILLATLLHLDRFHLNSSIFFAQAEAWGWLVLYIGLVPALIWAVLRQRREQGGELSQQALLPGWLRITMLVLGAAMVMVGLGLIVVPAIASSIWSWTLTPLTGRMVGAWFSAIGVSLLVGAKENDYGRVYVAAAAYIAYALLQTLNLLRYPATVQWSQASVWFLIVVLGGLFIIGVTLLRGYMVTRRASMREL